MQKSPPHPRVAAPSPINLQFFSPTEVAIILGVSRKLVMTWIAQGRLPAFRPGPENRLTRIRRQDLERFVERHMRGVGLTNGDPVGGSSLPSE